MLLIAVKVLSQLNESISHPFSMEIYIEFETANTSAKKKVRQINSVQFTTLSARQKLQLLNC